MRIAGVLLVPLTAVLLFVSTAPAMAQSPGGQCNGAGAMPGNYSIVADSGPAGTSATVTGSFETFPAVGQEIPLNMVQVWWLEAGNEQVLGEFEFTIGEDMIARFSGQVMIPGNAAPGPGDVGFYFTSTTDPACVVFTVVESARTDAYTQTTVTRLPSTGIMLLAPAAAMAVAGLGATVSRRRRH